MVPPAGGIVVGPCPQCSEFVGIFLGQVVPLDKAAVLEGSFEERHEHFMEAFTKILDERVKQLVENIEKPRAEAENGEPGGGGEAPAPSETPHNGLQPITEADMLQFQEKELALLDNPESFNSIFGQN